MFLGKGWKTFAHWYDLRRGDCLCCIFDGKDTLLVKAFNAHGDRLECCAESTSEACSENEDNSPAVSNQGGDSYSSYERDVRDVKPIPRRARKYTLEFIFLCL